MFQIATKFTFDHFPTLVKGLAGMHQKCKDTDYLSQFGMVLSDVWSGFTLMYFFAGIL